MDSDILISDNFYVLKYFSFFEPFQKCPKVSELTDHTKEEVACLHVVCGQVPSIRKRCHPLLGLHVPYICR